MEQLAERLRLLQAWAGMSYRAIHREVVRNRAARGVPERPVLNTVYRCFQPGRSRLDVELVVDVARVLLGDDAAAEQWRQACWVVTGQSSAAAIVNVADTWPDDLPSFTGRTEELRRIAELAGETRAGAAIVAIAGMPGVGKTRLAVRAGRALLAEVRLAVDLRGYDPDRPPADPNAVLEGFLRRLGMPGEQLQHLSITERATRYRELLAARSALVLLDNAASTEQVRPLLPDGPGCLVLITSRNRLTGLPAHQLPLDVLTPEESTELLRRITGSEVVDADPARTAQVGEMLGHLPIALALVASHIRASPEWTISDHLERLQHHRLHNHLDSGVEAAISLSYRDLRPDQRRTFRLLALHPGTDITTAAAAALTGGAEDDAARQLDELTCSSLLQTPSPGRYRFHDLIRVYATSRTHDEDPASARRAALGRLSDHYLHTAGQAMDLLYPDEREHRPGLPEPAGSTLADQNAARGWLDAELVNVLAVATSGTDSAILFGATLHRHLAVTGRYKMGEILHASAVATARRDGDPAGEADALLNLSELYVRTGRYELTIERCAEALDRAAGLRDWEGEGRALRYLGLVHQFTGRYEQAADYHRRGLAFCERVGDQRGQASALGNLGWILELTGKYEQAAEHQRQALTLFRSLGVVEDEARALYHLGGLYQITGRYELAAGHLRTALVMFEEIDDAEGQASALDHLGVLHQVTGQYEAAAECHRQALELSRRIGDPDDEARALNNLGTLLRRTGRYEEAVEQHNLALRLCQELGDPHGQAVALNGLGEAAHAAGDPVAAVTAHVEAHQHAGKIGHRREQARADAGLGQAHHDLGDSDQAREHWRQALAAYEELDLPEAGEIRAHLATVEGHG